jgi:hypothetical protein
VDPKQPIGGSSSLQKAAASGLKDAGKKLVASALDMFIDKGLSACKAQQKEAPVKGCACCVVRVYRLTENALGGSTTYAYGWGMVAAGSCDALDKSKWDGSNEIMPDHRTTDMARYWVTQTPETKYFPL